MRNLGFFAVAALLILVQSNLFRLLGPLGSLLGAHWVHGATPSLALPLVIFTGCSAGVCGMALSPTNCIWPPVSRR